MKKVKFFISNILRLFIFNFLFRNIIKPKCNHFVFGLKDITGQNLFMHNSKYMFLYLNNIEGVRCSWLTDNDDFIKKMKNYGYNNIYKRYSLDGIKAALQSKFWLYDFSNCTNCISKLLPQKSIKINLWHGIPIKKIEADSKHGRLCWSLETIHRILKPKLDYLIANSDYDFGKYLTAFNIKNDAIKQLGSPRLDVLYKDIPEAEIFLEKEIKTLKQYKSENKKLIFYVPTYRNDDKNNLLDWIKSKNVEKLFLENNAILVTKLHYLDAIRLKIESNNFIYNLSGDIDIYPLLKYSDAIISDYSSISLDYLVLDNPIIYHVPDIREYEERWGLYEKFENLAAGAITYNEQKLIDAMQDVIDGVDNYKEQRKALRDKMFNYQDGHNCERVAEFIRSLNK